MSKIKVMIADDHPLMRDGLQQILELEDDIEVVAKVGDGNEAVEKAITLKPDVILMDINMPNKNGIEAIEELKMRDNKARVIMLTIHDDRQYLLKAISSGAMGYVMKDAESHHLLKAIRAVHQGNKYIQQGGCNEERGSYTFPLDKKLNQDNLTRREIEVLLLIAEGKNNREIADELFISDKTVKNHVSSIFRKIGVSDRTQAAIYVLKHPVDMP